MITEVRNLKTSTENLGTHGEIRRYALVVSLITTPSLRLCTVTPLLQWDGGYMQANLTQDHGGEQKNKLFQDQQVSETKSFVGSP